MELEESSKRAKASKLDQQFLADFYGTQCCQVSAAASGKASGIIGGA